MKTVIFGVGNVYRCDDGAGPYLADMFENSENIISFNCGTAPENFTGKVRTLRPDLLIIADASLMNLSAGEVRIIPVEKIRDVSPGTHMMPLSHLVNYLSEIVEKIVIIGIQPKSLDDGVCMSEEVLSALDELYKTINEGFFEKIPGL